MVATLSTRSMCWAMLGESQTFNEDIFYEYKPLGLRATDQHKIIGLDGTLDKRGAGVKIAIIESGGFDCEGDTHAVITQATKDRYSQQNLSEINAGHLNFVASIIAGKNGIAPQSELEVIPYEGNSSCPGQAIAIALQQAIDAKVDYINMSIGFGSLECAFPQELRPVLLKAQDADIGILLAAGNENHLTSAGVTLGYSQLRGLDDILEEMNGHMRIVVSTSYEEKEEKFDPFNYSNKRAAKDKTVREIEEKASYFSNSLNERISKYGIAAPGEHILIYGLGSKPDINSGTSFATPAVTAAAAVVKSNFPYLKNVAVLTILAESARRQENPYRFGQGVLDIAAALKLAAIR